MPIRVFDPLRDGVPIPLIARQARLVVWPGNGARVASMNRVVLEPGEENVPHEHPESEDTIFIVEGTGVIQDLSAGIEHAIGAGCAVHVPPRVVHAVRAVERMVSVGGPCPPDVALLRACGLRWEGA
ncbi:MAG: cupin domain-containing protein [Armatimonadota bacterium]|nr:cupin domain-containing protein [Armatimonadota bacterium]MDR5698060.1 cupin domain-containing protein [Armatimonadota bacterium]